MEFDRDAVVKTFVAECEESFAGTEAALVALERAPRDGELVETVFRAMHTLKGNAYSLGLRSVSEFAHGVEDVLERIRDGSLPVDAAAISLLLAALDALRAMLPEAIDGNDELSASHAELLATLQGVGAEASAAGTAPALAAWAARRDRRSGRSQDDRPAARDGDRTLRVATRKLDRMLDLTGEITIALGRLRQALASEGAGGRAERLELHDTAEKLHLALQQEVLGVRMVPIGPVFRQLERAVRDLAAGCGKIARLETEGEDVEVDMSVVEQLRDPLTHMIRNAIDHGLEAPDVRRARGKDPCGRLRLRAAHDSGSIVIELEDDGAGFQRDRIAARARAAGLAAEPERLAPDELLRFVFEPGFSTTEAVTDLSGRGVGLDVVRENVERLHGSIAIASRDGCGATLTIRLPLTVAIIDGFGVGAGGETFMLPLDAVAECFELPATERDRGAGSGLLNLRGEALPYVRLCEVLGLPRGPRTARENVVVVRHARERAGIAVDQLYGESQTVIKPLGRVFHGLPGIAGAAILGTGRVALILDVPALLRRVVASAVPRPAAV